MESGCWLKSKMQRERLAGSPKRSRPYSLAGPDPLTNNPAQAELGRGTLRFEVNTTIRATGK